MSFRAVMSWYLLDIKVLQPVLMKLKSRYIDYMKKQYRVCTYIELGLDIWFDMKSICIRKFMRMCACNIDVVVCSDNVSYCT